MIQTFRFVELHPDNRLIFSYEYSSILRDTGSVFDSVMRKLCEGTKYSHETREYDFGDYRRFLGEHVRTIKDAPWPQSVKLVINRVATELDSTLEHRFVVPFKSIEDGSTLEWWGAFTGIKHSDIDRFKEGNLENCVSGLSALAILHALVCDPNKPALRLFTQVGVVGPSDSILLFSEPTTQSETGDQTTR